MGELMTEFELDKVYNQNDAVIFQDYTWVYMGKVWRLENGHVYVQKSTIGMYPSEMYGWMIGKDLR